MTNTVHEWNSQGLDQKNGQEFALAVSDIHALKVFLTSLPYWSKKHDTGVLVQISSSPNHDGVGIEIGFSRKTLPTKSAEDLIDLLKERNHLWELELVIGKMKELGCDPDVIDVLVEEANQIAIKIKDQFLG